MEKLNPKLTHTMIDANFLDLMDQQDPIAMQIDASECVLTLPHSVRSELENPSTPKSVRRLASRYLFSVEVNLTPPEQAKLKVITSHIRGNAESEKHDSDAFHIFEASKYGCRYFITCDQRLTKKANEIFNETQVEPIAPNDFANLLRK